MPTKLPDQVIRLNTVFNEWKKKQPTAKKGISVIAPLAGESTTNFHYMLKGERPISKNVVDFVCVTLGYSPEWFLKGTGKKFVEESNKTTLTDISALRTELAIMRHEMDVMKARMKSYEERAKK